MMSEPSSVADNASRKSRREVRKDWIKGRIVTAALDEVIRVGADDVSLVNVSKAANISRTTLYKYYPDRDVLLAAVSDRIKEIYQSEMTESTIGHDEPALRLRAVIQFMKSFHDRWHAEQMISLGNEQIIQDINRNFDFYHQVVKNALEPVSRVLLQKGVGAIGIDLLVDMLIRGQLSNALVPFPERWDLLADAMFQAWNRLIQPQFESE